jgi:hypothetical protein
MAKYTLTFTADATLQKVMTVKIPGTATEWFANSYVYGTFGGGTVTLFASPDGGTTKIALKDAISGNAISVATTAAMNTIRLGSGSKNDDNIIIYATLASSTNPALTLAIFDNLA